MLGTGNQRQVGGFAAQGLLRKPCEGGGFKIIAVNPEIIGGLHAAFGQQGSETVAQGQIMCAAAA